MKNTKATIIKQLNKAKDDAANGRRLDLSREVICDIIEWVTSVAQDIDLKDLEGISYDYNE